MSVPPIEILIVNEAKKNKTFEDLYTVFLKKNELAKNGTSNKQIGHFASIPTRYSLYIQ